MKLNDSIESIDNRDLKIKNHIDEFLLQSAFLIKTMRLHVKSTGRFRSLAN